MVSDSAFLWDGNDLVLSVKVVPGASREILSVTETGIQVRLTTPPQDGKANKRLSQVLGKLFGVPQSAVIIERGHTARIKSVRVRKPARLPDIIAG